MSFTARSSIDINSPASKVWEVLTDSSLVTQYLFGTEVETDWREGSSITYRGVWEGKAYEDKGKIIQMIPEKLLQTTYWSSASGKEDKSENYSNVTYALDENNEVTTLTITQDNIEDEDSISHLENNWRMVLGNIKKIAENLNV